DGALAIWTWVSASILGMASLTLLFAPRVLLFFSETSSEDRRALTSLESFLLTHCGVWLFAISISLIVNIPSQHTLERERTSMTHPLLLPLAIASGISSFLGYNTRDVGSVATLLSVGTGVIALWGVWVIVFGDSSSISKTTGADKHTSSFIFGNKASASKQKKSWKK
ncbi:hypothetical protein CPB85DRAFT_1157145, partial [Mucidula mucida]